MLVLVKLLGKLGQTFGRQHSFDITTPVEAFKALAANYPDFWQYLHSSDANGIGYRVLVGNHSLDLAELPRSIVSDQPLIIVPVVSGSGGVGRVIAGAALIGVALAAPGVGFLGLTATNFGLIGGALVVSGVSMLLSPTPKAPKDSESNKASFVFNGPVNTSAQGMPVPICYGRLIVGSQVISAGISTARI